MEQLLIAHDLGTSGDKATLFSVNGKLIKSVTCTYETNFFNGNWAEQNPEDWWKAVCKANHLLLENVDKTLVAAVAFSGQMMGCVLVDQNGDVLRKAIIWADQRSEKQAEFLKSKIEEQRFYRITGHKISPSYSLEKLMWVREHEPEIFEKTYKLLQPKDYIIYKMTGSFVTDYSDASGTNCFDINSFQWSEEILKYAGIPASMMPEACNSTDVAGVIPEYLSEECGLAVGTKIVIGGGDGVCAAVGAGAVRENIAYNYLGSSAWIAYASRQPVYDEQMRTYNWVHLVPGYYTPNGTMQAAGNSYEFIKNMLYGKQTKDVYRKMDKAIKKSRLGANGLLYLPYILGERSPRWNADARGAFVGLKMEHTQGDMLRAGLEGIIMNLCIILDIFKLHGDIQSINVIGGMANGKYVPALLADIYGIPVNCLKALNEATSMGAAVTAGVGCGIFSDFDAVHKFIEIDYTQPCDLENHRKYQEVKEAFDECYSALLPVYKKIKKF